MIYKPHPVNTGAYMNFKKATDGLFARVGHEDLASALGVSVAAIRQARLQPKANAHRAPPENWEDAVIRLAEKRVWHYRNLIEEVRSQKLPFAAHANGGINASRNR